ncbi:MAG: hypothetical protein Q8Q48_00560 [Candidatus Staskawiczbacteria bacterium]|nr:hypothetical protein [Candidatus Staskawiczbacteria bacterium]
MEEKPNSKKKWIFAISAILVVGLGGYFYFSGSNPITNRMKVPFPYVNSVANNTYFACESLLSSSIIGSPEEYLTNGIEGSVDKGTDKVAMSIKDEQTLTLQTGANVSAGFTEGDNFTIVQNDKNKLMAVWLNENAISTIALNKDNGLAVWLKGNPNFIIYDAPHGSIIYMVCR